MKISDIQIYVVGNRWKNWVFLKIETDEGISGLGESTSGLITMPVVSMLREIRHLCIGEDPTRIEALMDKLIKCLFLNESEAFLNAISGINIACWDILGKSLGVPLYRLLGGKLRNGIRAYANGWYQTERKPECFAERASAAVELGYSALKFDPFGCAYGWLDYKEKKLSLAIIQAVREAVGEEVDICIEGHDRLNIAEAKEIGRLLEPYHPLWYETPCMSSDIDGTVEIARHIPVPVATGERFGTLRDFSRLLASRSVQIVQPEGLAVGGISGLMNVCAIARGFDAWVAPHNAQSALTSAMCAHIGVAMPNIIIQECFDDFEDPWSRELLIGAPRVEDGLLIPSDAPGHGVSLNEALVDRYPYNEHNFMRLFTSGWETRRKGTC